VVTVRSRGRLPHWEESAATYFVTFRLADSLPKAKLAEIEFERRDIVATAIAMRRELSAGERERLAKLFHYKIDAYLDAGRGKSFLAVPRVAQVVEKALRHFDGMRYRLIAWCVMPNHVHVVFRPLGDHGLREILHTWKSFSANNANRILGRGGEFWQREYYDHLVRNETDFRRVIEYVVDNPKKAGLVDWPWVWRVGEPIPEE